MAPAGRGEVRSGRGAAGGHRGGRTGRASRLRRADYKTDTVDLPASFPARSGRSADLRDRNLERPSNCGLLAGAEPPHWRTAFADLVAAQALKPGPVQPFPLALGKGEWDLTGRHASGLQYTAGSGRRSKRVRARGKETFRLGRARPRAAGPCPLVGSRPWPKGSPQGALRHWGERVLWASIAVLPVYPDWRAARLGSGGRVRRKGSWVQHSRRGA